MRKLMDHQKKAIEFIKTKQGKAGLFLAIGTGKTLTAIRYAQEEVLPSYMPKLVVCRRDDFLTWEQELRLEGYRPSAIKLIQSSEDSMRAVKHWNLITYDLVKVFKRQIKGIDFGIVFADESHKIKRWKAKRTKDLISCTRHIPKRIAMTGTPITNQPRDVFSQCLFIDDGKLFGTSDWKFRLKYYLQSGPGWYLRHNAKDAIQNKLKRIAYYVDQDDVLNLPPIRRVMKAVPMSGMQKRYYNQVLEDWELEIEKGQIQDIDYVIVQLSKLRQISSGFFYKPDHTPVYLKSYKLKLLIELLKDPDYLANKLKLVIWCAHTAEIELLTVVAAKLGWNPVAFTGSNRKVKNEARRRFRDDKNVRLFIGQVDMGVGMNELIGSDTALYYSNSFKVEARLHSEGRTRRKGSEHHRQITYWDLVTENSTDLRVLKAVRHNISVANYILSGLREGKQITRILN